MNLHLLSKIIDALFPMEPGPVVRLAFTTVQESALSTVELGVTNVEFRGTIARLRAKRIASEPDGIPARALALALGALRGWPESSV